MLFVISQEQSIVQYKLKWKKMLYEKPCNFRVIRIYANRHAETMNNSNAEI